VVLDLVNTMAIAIEGVQHWLDGVGELGVMLELRGADVPTDLVQLRQRPISVVALDPLDRAGDSCRTRRGPPAAAAGW